jgi:hypothetical protein
VWFLRELDNLSSLIWMPLYIRSQEKLTYATVRSYGCIPKELLAYLAESGRSSRPAGVPDLEKNFATLIHRLADTLREARDRESENRRDQRLERIIDTFSTDHPSGCTRDLANVTLNRIDSAVDDTTAGDIIQNRTARLRRNFKLTAEPLKKVEDYSAFLEAIKNLRHLERLTHQGVVDPNTNGATKK